ncbi:S-adenosylmethionine:tRNA ribosyltransferase-isomerase [Rickettsia canadensis str. McKiel]|uniref:S-adenosylmethionine:tRNA ribosyltransferase-isomerase n=1 Tax=Rickettsia canadensis (strain McKiel) TaxID=293613 RepID=QUEA_RICCK|nr:tRNA preQ1(34) S-adenosylmethionine ribosyltransferase-isomerase QueA [Rickettsia canadensis]A8EXV6.1 RecName: Full=S-adenosylmethionine:tRNA ribosyltransferase-isomerase; AltName: Full=Queuosine biosynthesis protein QueA [Rickettsia canadensis str. McKiel]ABV73189.1 S-adenosylmethionine:tRNA ribosyltransferase-isomerase [Rickettsia canadensis str. McKiel]
MKLSDFDFDLPSELIAQYPSSKRDHSDLLIAATPPIKTKFYNIIDYLKEGDLLVFNNSKVIKAKLNLEKNRPLSKLAYRDKFEGDMECRTAVYTNVREDSSTGSTYKLPLEVELEKRSNITINLNQRLSNNCWSAFAKPARRLNIGDEFHFDNHKVIIVEKLAIGEIKVKFELDDISVFEFLDKYGEMPLPLYIRHHEAQKSNNERYQNIYSSIEGSVAAPTAGLHFTNDILNKLKAKNIQTTFLTLHVGAGTFLPVKTENIHEHKMHTEYCSITPDTARLINKAKQEKQRIIAVGTTTLRTLESSCNNGTVKACDFETDIFITPGFKFQTADILLTNFHFPKSTLFMLICAFAGFKEMHKLYKYAIKEKMRFFSYGDATLLYRKI